MNHVLSKNKKFFILLICLLLGIVQWTAAQNIQVQGKVTDEKGEAVIGASVVQKGTSNGIATNVNGDFTLSVPGNATLVVSYLGYNSKEIAVNNQSRLSIQLSEDTQLLQEVVVTTGYITQKKLTTVGAISTISNKELAVTKNENVVNALAGKMPGLRIMQRNSMPGSYNSIIDIRGMAEIIDNQRTTPLFVIDGVPRDQEYFSRMDSEEIESITVLKDASAAVYGLRAASGVILVTTKSGTSQSGKVDISYSGNVSVQHMIYIPKGVSVPEYMTIRNEQNWQDFGNNYLVRRAAVYGPEDFQKYYNGEEKSYDWVGKVFDMNPLQTKHNLSIDGGNDNLRYYVNIGYSRMDGCYASGSLWEERWNFRSNVDAKITKKLSANIKIGAILGETNTPSADRWDVFKNVWLQYPYAPFYANDNPDYLNGDDKYVRDSDNPLAKTDSKYVGYRVEKNRRVNGTFGLRYEIFKGLVAKASYDYAFSIPDVNTFNSAFSIYKYDPVDKYYQEIKRGSPAISRSVDFSYDTDLQLQLEYANRFGDHSVSGTVVFEEQYNEWEGFNARRELKINVPYLFAGEADNQEGKGGTPGDRLNQAFIGQFGYDYAGKYIVDFRFRYDGSSRYPAGHRWGFFPSVSLGWRISEEGFIKNNLEFIHNLKLRGSYGVIGNDAAAKNYPPIYVGYDMAQTNRGWYFSEGSYGLGVSATAIPNPNLTWYTVTMKNIGLDFDFLRSKLYGAFDFFQNDTDGILDYSDKVIPGTIGATLPQENLNKRRNFGWELELGHRNTVGNVEYFITGQVSAARRQSLYSIETPASHSFDYWKNRKSGRYSDIKWSREASGYFSSYNEIVNFNDYPVPQGTLPGDWYAIDWNGDGINNDDDQHPYALEDLPLFNYGASLGGMYKGFDLTVNFQGSYKVYSQYGEVFTEALAFGGGNTMHYFMDRWHPVDPEADLWAPGTEWISGYYPITGRDGRRAWSNAISDVSYVRLKTLEFGYTIPKKLTSKISLKNLRIYFSGYNLLTFSKRKDIDPERPGSTERLGNYDPREPGYVGMYMYPNNQTFTFGLNVKF